MIWCTSYTNALIHTFRNSFNLEPEAVTRYSVRKGVLRNFAKFIGINLCQSLFFNKVAGLNLIKKETLLLVFSSEFCEISKNTFLTEHLRATTFWECFFLWVSSTLQDETLQKLLQYKNNYYKIIPAKEKFLFWDIG